MKRVKTANSRKARAGAELSHDRRTFGFLFFLVIPLKSLPPRGKVSFRGRGGLWRGGRLSERLDGCMCRKRLGAASRHGGQRVVRCVRQRRRETEMKVSRLPRGTPFGGLCFARADAVFSRCDRRQP